jgi:hypothetical protein
LVVEPVTANTILVTTCPAVGEVMAITCALPLRAKTEHGHGQTDNPTDFHWVPFF